LKLLENFKNINFSVLSLSAQNLICN